MFRLPSASVATNGSTKAMISAVWTVSFFIQEESQKSANVSIKVADVRLYALEVVYAANSRENCTEECLAEVPGVSPSNRK